MGDVKDILGVPRGTPNLAALVEEKEKVKKDRVKRPEGMSREAFALLDGSHPIVPAHLTADAQRKNELKGLKQKRKPSARGQVTWQFREFANGARGDGLLLRHWAKCLRDATGKVAEENPEYAFEKFNKKPMVYSYNDEEWDSLIAPNPDWSREETSHLLEQCRLYDLRFVVVADRYQWPGKQRSMEDLKARYYSIARQLMVGRQGSEDAVSNQVIVKQPYDAEYERTRKLALELLLRRSALQDAQDQAILEEAAVIEASRKQEARAAGQAAAPAAPAAAAPHAGAVPGAHTVHDARRASGASAEAPAAPSASATPAAALPADFSEDAAAPGAPPLFDANVQPFRPRRPGVYARGVHLKEVAAQQIAKLPGGQRSQKLVDGMMAELGFGPRPDKTPWWPAVPTRAVCGSFLALRAEIIALIELRKRAAHRHAAEGGGGGAGAGKRAGKGKIGMGRGA